jgi:hypothetical protein
MHGARSTSTLSLAVALAGLGVAWLMVGSSVWIIELGPPPLTPPVAPDRITIDRSVGTWTLSGTVVLAHTGLLGVNADVPIPGVSVVLAVMDPASPSCGGSFPTAATCSVTAQTVTSSGASAGTFSFTLAPGRYWLYSKPSNVTLPTGPTVPVGGDASYIDLTGNQQISLVVYRLVAYGNRSIVLPAWNNLTSYVDNVNGNTQVPILSYTQDGVVYVNATGEWVFYSFPNRTIEDLGRWTPLYGNVANYAGDLENAGFLTVDGSYLYEVGCATSCTSSSSIEVAALNITTHRVFQHTFSTLSDSALGINGGVNLIGERGNSSIVVVFDSGGGMHAWNLWNNTEWNLGTLPFFEANNNYWVPQLDSFLDVEAGGSAGDRIVQLRLEGTGAGTTLTTVATLTTGYSVTSNYVDGIVLNLSSSEVAFSYGFLRGFTGITAVYSLANGILQNEVRTYKGVPTQSWPNNSALQSAFADEHRIGVTTGAPTFQSFANGLFYNNSLLVDPFTGTFFDTNVTEPNLNGFNEFNQSIPAGNGPAPSNLFYNGSYFLTGFSVNCALQTSNDLCPLRGTTPGTAAGTVYWAWQLGLPEFPFRPAASLAETAGPDPPTVSAMAHAPGVVSANWSVVDAARVVNWTVWIGPEGGMAPTPYNLPANTRAWSWRSLPGASSYNVTVLPWNLHGPGRPTSVLARVNSSSLYSLSFVGAGLPSSPPTWYLVLNGSVYAVPNGTFSILEGNGTYAYAIRSPPGYRTSPLNGVVQVEGRPVSKLIAFVPVTFPVAVRVSWDPSVVFPATEGNWSFVVNGVVYSTTNPYLDLTEPNGTYSYVVRPPASLISTPSSGAFRVAGAAQWVYLDFSAPEYPVLFVESGLAPRTHWTVDWLAEQMTSTTPWIEVNATNGTYSYLVVALAGYTLTPPGNHTSVNGTPVTIWALFTRNATPPTSPFPKDNVSTGGFAWGLTAALVVAGIIGGGAVGFGLARRRPDRSSSSEGETESANIEPEPPEAD